MTTRMNVCLALALFRPHLKANIVLTPKLASEELSEEDQQLKNELDMLVERLSVRTRPAAA